MTAFGQGDGLAPREASELIGAGRAVALDVRERYEWDAGHIAGALHVPLSELARRLAELPDGNIVAVCRSGSRSDAVTEALRGLGRPVENLLGGMQAWQREGLPIEPADGWIA